MALLFIPNANDNVVLLNASTTASQTSDAYNIAAYQRASVQVVGDNAEVQTSLNGVNFVTLGSAVANGIVAIPHLARYVRVVKSNNANAVSAFLMVSLDGPAF